MRRLNFLFCVLVVLAVVLGSSGCDDAASCEVDDDCFSGEVCVSGSCVPDNSGDDTGASDTGAQDTGGDDTDSADTGTDDTDTPDTGTDDSGGDDTNTADTGTDDSTDQDTSSGDSGDAGESCIIDPFDNTCQDDPYEDNDSSQQRSVLGDAYIWCPDGVLDESPQTFQMQMCAGDPGDALRIAVSNQSNCIDGSLLITATFEIDRPCDESYFRIVPNWNGAHDNLCDDSTNNVQCTVSDDGLTHTIKWLWTDVRGWYDAYVWVGTNQATNVQFGYDVTVTVEQQ